MVAQTYFCFMCGMIFFITRAGNLQMPLYNLFLGSLHYDNICFSNQSLNILLKYMLLVTIIYYNQNSVCSFRFMPYWSPLKVILILYLYFPDAVSMCLALVAYKTLYLDVLETLPLSNCVKKKAL